MASLSDAIIGIDAIAHHLSCSAGNPKGPDLTDKEKADSRVAKSEVMRVINKTIKALDISISAAHEREQCEARREETRMDEATQNEASMLIASDVSATSTDAERIRQGMTGVSEQAHKTAKSMGDMAEAIAPIYSTFTKVLENPYLGTYNATLNTVPVVGLKGDHVMYVETKNVGVGVQDIWSVFSKIPDGVNINSMSSVHFFPFHGHFCMSVGKAVWMKKHREQGDPLIKEAINAFPKLYLDEWTHVGDKVLPDAKLHSIVPFVEWTQGGEQKAFHLVTLNSDGVIQFMDVEDLGSQPSFSDLRNASDADQAKGVKFQKIAYYNNKFVGYDHSECTWNISPDFSNKTYLVTDQYKVGPLSELTATDAGPIGVQKDGFLYKRLVEAVKEPGKSEQQDTIKWTKWISQNGVTSIGVASPGVMLDLETLTLSLRDRYVSTQTALYPVVAKTQTFAITHEVFLQQIMDQAKELTEDTIGTKKHTEALKTGTKFIKHAKIWASLMKTQAGYSHTAVTGMSKDLGNVRKQLSQQLQILRDKLSELERQLGALKEAESKLKAAFWVSLAVAVLGLGLMIAAVVTGVGIGFAVAAGGLFVGGLVATIIFGKQMTDLSNQISQVESQIEQTRIAINALSTIVDSFKDLENMYGSLNEFWGAMYNAASSLVGMDDATKLILGTKVLDDTSSVEAGIKWSRKLKYGCDTYMSVLHRIGIKIPKDDDDDDEDDAGDVNTNSLKGDIVVDATFQTLGVQKRLMRQAHQALESNDFDAYVEQIEAADLVSALAMTPGVTLDCLGSIVSKTTTTVVDHPKTNAETTGPNTNGTAAVSSAGFYIGIGLPGLLSAFLPNISIGVDATLASIKGPTALLAVGRIDSAAFAVVRPFLDDIPQCTELNYMFEIARTEVMNMLQETMSSGDAARSWLKEVPDVPVTDEEQRHVAELQKVLSARCKSAISSSLKANNTFVEVNHRAQEVDQQLARDIVTLQAVKSGLERDLDNSIRDLGRWDIRRAISIIVGGGQQERDRIESLTGQLDATRARAERLQMARNVGMKYDGNSKSWIQLCADINERLGAIYNMTNTIETQIKCGLSVDPEMYKKLAQTEWDTIERDARSVIQILQDSAAASYHLQPALDMTRSYDATASDWKNVVVPNASLGPDFITQTTNSGIIWSDLDKLDTLTFTEDIVGYWDAAASRKVTLSQVIASVRAAYRQVAATQYGAVQQLHDLASLQGIRAKNLAKGKLTARVFLKQTILSLSAAKKESKQGSALAAQSLQDFRRKMAVILVNLDSLKKAIKLAQTDLKAHDQAFKDKVTGLIVSASLTGFASGTLVAASIGAAIAGIPMVSIPTALSGAAFLFDRAKDEKKASGEKEDDEDDDKQPASESSGEAPKGKASSGLNGKIRTPNQGVQKIEQEEETGEPIQVGDVSKLGVKAPKNQRLDPKDVEKRLGAAQKTWTAFSTQLRAGKNLLAATTIGKALFNKMSLEELSHLSTVVATAITVMEQTVAAMEHIEKPLNDLAGSIGVVSATINSMHSDLESFARSLGPSANLTFNKHDAALVSSQWEDIEEACDLWLNAINRQGIVILS